MKKTIINVSIIITVVLLIMYIFYACNAKHSYKFEQDKSEVKSVVIVLEKDGEVILRDSTIELLDEIEKLPCGRYHNDPDVLLGEYYVIVEYNDGECEFIGQSTSYYQKSVMKKHYKYVWFDDDDFYELLDRF